MSYARWNPVEYYVVNDIVNDNTLPYQCIQANGPLTPQQPSTSPLYWTSLTVAAPITGVAAGMGTLVTNPAGPVPIVNNNGILSILPGTGISVTAGQNPTVSATGLVPIAHGGFISTVNQPLTAATPRYMVYDTVTSAISCSLVVGTGGGLSGIKVANTGVYQIIFSVQWDKFGGGGTDNVQAWYAVNGTPVPWSNSEIDITQQINQVTTVDIMLSLNANDVVEIVGYTPAGTQVRALANPIDLTHPVGIPSIITDIVRIA